MIMTTTGNVEGRRITGYLGIVSGEPIMGINTFKDLFASIRDIVGRRSASYEEEISSARTHAMAEMEARAARLGADAIVRTPTPSAPQPNWANSARMRPWKTRLTHY